MKKVCLAIVVMLCVLWSAAALGEQKIYATDSEEYQELCDVYLAAGCAMPSSTGPWSASELLLMYNRINGCMLPDFIRPTYERLGEQLSERPERDLGDFGFSLDGNLSLFGYYHTNTNEVFQGHDAFMADTRIPSLSLGMDFSYGNNFHFFFEPVLQNTEISKTEVGATNLFTNIMLLQDFENGGDFDMSMPDRAYAAFGGRNFSVQIGRDRISWGLGTTGNVTISDNIPRHDFARFTVFSSRFKFTYLVSVFPHKSNYYVANGTSGKFRAKNFDGALSGVSMYIGHRIEGRFLHDKLSVTITEAMMYATEDNYLNMSAFNPAMLFHNLYIANNSNSTLAFEADYTPVRNLNIYGQFLIDDFAGPGEDKTTDTTKGSPNAFGLVLGASYLTGAPAGTAKFNLEFAKIDPYTYLRYSNNSHSDGSDEVYGLDYVVAMRFYAMSDNLHTYEEFVLGYTYGPDCIVGNLNATYTSDDRNLSLSANAFVMAHGTHDIWTSWMRTGNQEGWEDDYTGPSTRHLTTNRNDDNAQSRNAVQYTADFGIAAQYRLFDCLTCKAQFDVVAVKNPGNISSSDIIKDFQLMLGATYSF